MNAPRGLLPIPPDRAAAFDWRDADYLKAIMDALDAAAPGGSRFVGGCVRDSLFGLAPKDFDIATILTPEAVVDAAAAAGLRSAPTGIDHGTVTVIADHRGVEATTLRADVSTDGRRATVAYTEDWAVDAARRDFTINAIYLTADGFLYDPMNGLADIDARRVRFIGDATQRIKEDYLRILRFFRFSARFSDTMDQAGLEACAALKDGMAQLSAERIGAEFMATLSLPRAGFALEAMKDCGALGVVWDAPADIDAVKRLKEMAPEALAPVVLAALFGAGGEGIGAALRLSNAEQAQRAAALKGAAAVTPQLDEQAVRALIYRLGRDVFADAAALAFAAADLGRDEFQRLAALNEGWRAPAFPLSGRDLTARGVAPGPEIARLLAAVEARWIDEDFPDAARANAILEETIAKSGRSV